MRQWVHVLEIVPNERVNKLEAIRGFYWGYGFKGCGSASIFNWLILRRDLWDDPNTQIFR